jgi:hypothetical protein
MNWVKILNKNIIIAIIVVIIIAAAAAFVFGVGKTQTQISIVNNETFQNGEQVEIVLKDAQGNAIAGQSIEITFKGNEKLTVTTDNNGKGYLLISSESAGKADVEAKYAGNDKYAGCTAKETITITDDIADNKATQTSGSSVTSTDVNTKNRTDPNTDPHAGCYYNGQHEMWIRYSDNVIVEAPHNPEAVGLTFEQWYEQYVRPILNDDSGNSNNNTV